MQMGWRDALIKSHGNTRQGGAPSTITITEPRGKAGHAPGRRWAKPQSLPVSARGNQSLSGGSQGCAPRGPCRPRNGVVSQSVNPPMGHGAIVLVPLSAPAVLHYPPLPRVYVPAPSPGTSARVARRPMPAPPLALRPSLANLISFSAWPKSQVQQRPSMSPAGWTSDTPAIHRPIQATTIPRTVATILLCLTCSPIKSTI